MAYRPRNRIWMPAALSASAVSLVDMQEHLRVSDDGDVALINDISIAATAAVEKWTQRLLVRRQVVVKLPGLPIGLCPIELPGGQVGAVETFTAEGVAVTGAAVYGDSPAVLVPSAEWPVVTDKGYPVTITYTVGYLTVPQDLKAAVKLIASDLYERRGHSSEAPLSVVPISAEWLMARHRIMAI
jgi:uncharacterized phiE125 gp8 family phage protein